MMLIEGVFDIVLFKGFMDTNLIGKIKWLALYPLCLVAMAIFYAYVWYVRIYIAIKRSKH